MKDLNDMYTGFTTWLPSKEVGYTTDGTRDLAKLFDNKIFDFPKPSKLIQTLIEQVVVEEDDIVLDFFAGSGTTAQAVIDSSFSMDKSIRFILVQMPESLSEKSIAFKNGYTSIANVSIDRIRRALSSTETKHGVRFMGLSTMQVKGHLAENIGDLFAESTTQKTYNPQTLLWEVALNEGFPLDSRVETRRVGEQTIHTLTSDFHEFALHCCFDPTVAPAAAPEITLGENDVLVCLDSALDDQTKLRLSDKGLLKTI